jgi:sugar phosphate isomerase/epimerase
MIQSSITISLVPEAKGGPFVFWGDLAGSCAKAAELGFDAMEIFAPSAEDLDARVLRQLLAQHSIKLAAMGTGAGWVLRKLRLTDADPAVRTRARQFIGGIIDFAGSFGAPTIIGSMQGRFENEVTREQALGWLREALDQLGSRAHACGVPLLFEPLNRYETNLINSVAEGLELLQSLTTKNVKLLADLFHMNIEEVSISNALRAGGSHIGHVHFVDSNRHPAGTGHIDLNAVAQALREIGFSGYVSAEALPFPDSDSAAKQTMASFRSLFQ